MGCDDYPRPERDIAYDETLKLVGQLTGVASYGRDLLKAYQQRGTELAKLRAQLAAVGPVVAAAQAVVAEATGRCVRVATNGDLHVNAQKIAALVSAVREMGEQQ